jgi:Icc protein
MEQHVSHQIPTTNDASVMLVQLTDSHLFEREDGRLLGLETQKSLERVVELVRQEQPNIDLIVATGDLAQDGTVDAYARFASVTAPLQAPICWTSGNHDDAACMVKNLQDGRWVSPIVDIGAWRVIMLDSSVPGAVHGEFSDRALSLLEQSLRSAGDRHVLICMHHHPVPMGSAWIDGIGLQRPERLFEVIDRFPSVRALLWGHVHQKFDSSRGAVRLMASPSTCVQFAPGRDEFEVSREAPGYRWLRLHADGQLDTGVSRLAEFEFELDYTAGY